MSVPPSHEPPQEPATGPGPGPTARPATETPRSPEAHDLAGTIGPRRPSDGRNRTARPRHPDRACLNCGDPTYGEYCPTCGQRKVDLQVSVREMVMDILEDELLLSRRLPRTLAALMFKPGTLTAEVLGGRVVRYARPFKLYLASSVVFFLVLSFASLRAIERVGFGGAGGDPSTTLAGIDSSLAAVDSALAAPELSPSGAVGLALARSALEGQRAQLLAGPDAGDAEPAPEPVGAQRTSWIGELRVNTGNARVDGAIAARLGRLGRMEPREAAQELVRTFLSYGPVVMFVLLPVFAGALKLLYLRRGRYYAEHFLFLLHTHAFLFLIFTVMLLARGWLSGGPIALLLTWAVVYVYLAMKRVYGQGWLKTFVKYWTLGWTYFWILAVSIPLVFVASLLLLPS